VLSKALIKVLGLFIPILKEMHEMLYQYDRDYFFNSETFAKRFPDFATTAYNDGIRKTVEADTLL
jgi:hypothetical protein